MTFTYSQKYELYITYARKHIPEYEINMGMKYTWNRNKHENGINIRLKCTWVWNINEIEIYMRITYT